MFELPKHPLLDLTETEVSALLQAERDELGTVVTIEQARSIHRLWGLGLIEVHDGAWVPTANRGSTVALIFSRLESLENEEINPEPAKQAAMEAGILSEIRHLTVKVCAISDV